MERYRLTVDQAFRLLARASHTTNRKLRDIAEELTRPAPCRSSGHSRQGPAAASDAVHFGSMRSTEAMGRRRPRLGLVDLDTGEINDL